MWRGRPYWTDGRITLYLGDCREVTEWRTADVLVTDPPYGRAWRQGHLPGHTRHEGGIEGDKDTSVRDAALEAWGKRQAAVFGDLMLAPATGTRQVLIYAKPNDAGLRGALGGFRRDAEAIYLIGKWPSGIGGTSSVLRSGSRMVSGGSIGLSRRYGHPHAKPVDILEQLIAASAPGVIADPFAGSGSTLIAARNQGRQAVGVEIEERYAEACARRLDQGALDLDLSATRTTSLDHRHQPPQGTAPGT
jgi:DNA modification methylase